MRQKSCQVNNKLVKTCLTNIVGLQILLWRKTKKWANWKKGSLNRNLGWKKVFNFFKRRRWLHLTKENFGNIAKTLAEILKVYVIHSITYECLSYIHISVLYLTGLAHWSRMRGNHFQIGIQIYFYRYTLLPPDFFFLN